MEDWAGWDGTMKTFLDAVQERIAVERLERLAKPGRSLPTMTPAEARRASIEAVAEATRRQRGEVLTLGRRAIELRATGLLWTVVAQRLGRARATVKRAVRAVMESM